MKINHTSLTFKIRSLVDREYEKKIDVVNDCIKFIVDNKYLSESTATFKITHKNDMLPHYNIEHRLINIPLDYEGDMHKLYNSVEKNLKEKSLEYILLHEMGHAVQYSLLPENDSNGVYFEKNESINEFFSGEFGNKKLSRFLTDSYQEAYADCYAAFNLYMKYDDVWVFDDIGEYRKEEKDYQKRKFKNQVTEYFNTDAISFLKSAVLNGKNIGPFSEVHNLIQKCVLKGMSSMIVKELETNNGFLKSFIDFASYVNEETPINSFFVMFKAKTEEYNVISDNELKKIIDNEKLRRNFGTETPDFLYFPKPNNFFKNIKTKDQLERVTMKINTLREKNDSSITILPPKL